MTGRAVLGHIDCPTCGAVKGMRITHDKNDHPFGYCEADCSQQLRIGGDQRRVKKFVERYPWAAAPVTDAGAASAKASAPPPATSNAVPVTAKKPAPAPVTVTAPAKRAGPFDFLTSMGAKA